jgi:2'-5' RNA ligase
MEAPYYRTFFALPVQPGRDLLEVREQIMRDLKGERISWVDPSLFHVTLRFLGDTPVKDVKEISAALRHGDPWPDAFSVHISGVDSFGTRGHPRVIWAGFQGGEIFRRLKEALDDLLADFGMVAEKQPFRAHLTLGRIRSLQDAGTFYEIIRDLKDRVFETVCFDRLVYYRSVLGSGAPEYSELGKVLFR